LCLRTPSSMTEDYGKLALPGDGHNVARAQCNDAKAGTFHGRSSDLAGSTSGLEMLDKYFDHQVHLHKIRQEHIDAEIVNAKATNLFSRLSSLRPRSIIIDWICPSNSTAVDLLRCPR
jgi:hypothetical protein